MSTKYVFNHRLGPPPFNPELHEWVTVEQVLGTLAQFSRLEGLYSKKCGHILIMLHVPEIRQSALMEAIFVSPEGLCLEDKTKRLGTAFAEDIEKCAQELIKMHNKQKDERAALFKMLQEYLDEKAQEKPNPDKMH